MASDRVQISRLQFAGTPTSRFAICRSWREMALTVALLIAALAAAAVLYVLTRNPQFLLLLLVPMLVHVFTAVVWPDAVWFPATGNVPALCAYLDQLMCDAHEYQRSVRANGEIAFQRTVKGRFADARSHCVLAARTGSVEVRGSRELLRRLRYRVDTHFARADQAARV